MRQRFWHDERFVLSAVRPNAEVQAITLEY